jgi:hypothetical protein
LTGIFDKNTNIIDLVRAETTHGSQSFAELTDLIISPYPKISLYNENIL